MYHSVEKKYHFKYGIVLREFYAPWLYFVGRNIFVSYIDYPKDVGTSILFFLSMKLWKER